LIWFFNFSTKRRFSYIKNLSILITFKKNHFSCQIGFFTIKFYFIHINLLYLIKFLASIWDLKIIIEKIINFQKFHRLRNKTNKLHYKDLMFRIKLNLEKITRLLFFSTHLIYFIIYQFYQIKRSLIIDYYIIWSIFNHKD
jgi:hypothetical protein